MINEDILQCITIALIGIISILLIVIALMG